MARKKGSKKKRRITIKDVNQKLEDEINERTKITDFLTEEKNILYKKIMREIRSKKESQKRLENRIEEQIKQIGKVKDDLLHYSLQIVAIIVAILAIVMTFSFLSTDYYKAPEQFVWLVALAILYFSIIFTLWANAWRKRNKNVRRFGDIFMSSNGENIRRDNDIRVTDWLQYLEYKSTSNLNHLLNTFTLFFSFLIIVLSIFALVNTPYIGWTIFGIDFRPVILLIVIVALVFIIIINILFARYSYPTKEKLLAECLLKDILINGIYKTVAEIEEKWKSEERKIRDLGKFERYTYE